MIKSILTSTALAALFTLSTASAGDMTNVQFYGGLQGGGIFSQNKFKTDSNRGGVQGVGKVSANPSNQAWMGGAFVGARYFMKSYFVGLEGELNFDGLKVNQPMFDRYPGNVLDWKMELKRGYQGIISMTGGWKYNETVMFYAKLGVGMTQYSLREGGIGQATDKTVKTNITSFIPALGVEYDVHKNAAVRLEVAGDFFGRDIKGNSATGNLSQSTRVRYQAGAVKLGVLAKI